MSDQCQITRRQVDIYAEFDGNSDMYQRRGRSDPEMSWSAWRTIDDLRRRLFIVSVGSASETFKAAVLADVEALVPDADARAIVRNLVEKDIRAQSAKA